MSVEEEPVPQSLQGWPRHDGRRRGDGELGGVARADPADPDGPRTGGRLSGMITNLT